MKSEKIIFITAYIDSALYHKCVTENPFVRDNPDIESRGFDNTLDNQFISKRYNQFLNSWNYDEDAWFIFCHSDWEILEDISKKLPRLDKNTVYGPIGAITKVRFGKLLHIYRGYCREESRDGKESLRLECRNQRTGALVDTLDAQCMIIHSSLIKRYGLRFDEAFDFDLYCEDFSINAKLEHGVKTRILRIECCHHNIARNLDGREGYFKMLDIINRKFPDVALGSTVKVLGGKASMRPIKHMLPKFIDTTDQ